MKRPAVFIDRDGTLNEQMGYINHLSRFILLPGVAQAIRLLNENQHLAIVVSNQSGVARGYFPLDLVHKVNEHMVNTLKQDHAALDGIYFCPHYPRGEVPEFSIPCDCRKPGTGLIDQACKEFSIDMTRSYVIGDRATDMMLAKKTGLKGILVKTGYGRGDIEYVLPNLSYQPAYIAEDLLDGVRWILQKQSMYNKEKNSSHA